MATILRRPAGMQQPATYNQARATGMPPPLAAPQSTRTGNPPPTPRQTPPAPTGGQRTDQYGQPLQPATNPADATSQYRPPPGYNSWHEWQLDQQRKKTDADMDAYNKFIAGGGVLPPGAMAPNDPRLLAGGGPHQESNYGYRPGLNGNPAPYWLPRYSEEEWQASQSPAALAADKARTQANTDARRAADPWVQELLARHLMG